MEHSKEEVPPNGVPIQHPPPPEYAILVNPTDIIQVNGVEHSAQLRELNCTLCLSIFTTLCCCHLFGAISLSFALLGRILYGENPHYFKERAKNASRISRYWACSSIVAGLIIMSIVLCCHKRLPKDEWEEKIPKEHPTMGMSDSFYGEGTERPEGPGNWMKPKGPKGPDNWMGPKGPQRPKDWMGPKGPKGHNGFPEGFPPPERMIPPPPELEDNYLPPSKIENEDYPPPPPVKGIAPFELKPERAIDINDDSRSVIVD